MVGRTKISLDKPGALLVCTQPAKFYTYTKQAKRLKPQISIVDLGSGEVVMYLGCWAFSESLCLTEFNRHLQHNDSFRNRWMHPRDIAMLSFLHGEQILRIKFAGSSAQLKDIRKQSIKERSLFAASFWLYTHFEMATPKGEEM